jgi:integrase
MALTDTQIRNAKAQSKPYKIYDAFGLHMIINPTGSKVWRLKYHYHNKEKLVSLGKYPFVSLKDARTKADEYRSQLAQGLDPSSEKQKAKADIQAGHENSFRAMAKAYRDKVEQEGKAEATLAKLDWMLNMAFQEFGDRPITDIKAPDILVPLKKLEVKGHYETAKKLRGTIGRVFRYAIAHGKAENDPTHALRGALITPRVTHRAAITCPQKLSGLLKAVDAFDGQPATRIALQLLILLVPRPGELRKAEWSQFDLEKATWTIPDHITKMRREHKIPLPERALHLLEELKDYTGFSELLFPSLRSSKRPMSENTLNAALRRMGYGKEDVCAHGFRTTFSTLANESGLWNPDAIERALAHMEQNEVRRAYPCEPNL